MTHAALAEFEIVTLQFVKDTQTPTPGYSVEMLAITVLNQEVLYPDTEDKASATLGLQVAFRTVGVVDEGAAPRDFNFTDITDTGFEKYFGEYLYRLSTADSFFSPLSEHIDTTTLIPLPEVSREFNEPRKKRQFVSAVLFATTALAIAMGATIYAVRKQLRRETRKVRQLEYPGLGTRTMSDEPECRDEENPARRQEVDVLSDLSATLTPQGRTQIERVGMDSMPLQLNIGDERIEMEDVGLTPISMPPGYRTSFSSAHKPPRVPGSPSDMECCDEKSTFMDLKRSSFGRAFGMKKWLTPRKCSPKNKSTVDFGDPPESEIIFESNSTKPKISRTSMDPDAVKASTEHSAGVLSDEDVVASQCKSPSKGKNPECIFTGNTPLAIPVNFFGRSGDTKSDATSNNIDSMIVGSTASSFFNKIAGRKSSVFAGHKKVQSDIVDLIRDNSAYRSDQDDQNLVTLQTNSNENVETTIPDNGSYFEKKRSTMEPFQMASQLSQSIIKKEGPNIISCQEKDRAQTQTSEVDSVYSEQSELDLNELGIETTLGALPPQYGDNTPRSRDSFVGHEYGSRPNADETSSKKYHSSNSQSAAMIAQQSIGIQEMAVEGGKRRISLNTIIKQGHTFDVFAPAGPIGIVVDTSKMGPAVHSLKSTSPMLGLINPGDLIIALDDQDTRDMTAASLTRLMAKKSRQKERRITLVAPDGL